MKGSDWGPFQMMVETYMKSSSTNPSGLVLGSPLVCSSLNGSQSKGRVALHSEQLKPCQDNAYFI